jgi:hypothetical protein
LIALPFLPGGLYPGWECEYNSGVDLVANKIVIAAMVFLRFVPAGLMIRVLQ